MHIHDALPIALRTLQKLQGCCTHINIAGSIRREREYVKDIEVVCEPKSIIVYDLWGHPTRQRRLPAFSKAVKELGKIIKGWPDEDRYVQLELDDHEINLDLFMPQHRDYFRIFAIRTGSTEFSQIIAKPGQEKVGAEPTTDSGFAGNVSRSMTMAMQHHPSHASPRMDKRAGLLSMA